MIYLIGGPPKCGKTTLAKELSKKTGFSYISTDSLQCAVRAYIDKKELEKLFPASFMRCESNDEKYEKYSDKEIVEAYIKQGETLYNAIDMMAICEITEKNNIIIEGYHITPELVYKLTKKYGEQEIKAIFLVKINKNEFIENIKNSTTQNDWIIQRTKNSETYSKIAKMVVRYSKFFKHQASSYGYSVFYMDGNFEEKINYLIDFITR